MFTVESTVDSTFAGEVEPFLLVARLDVAGGQVGIADYVRDVVLSLGDVQHDFEIAASRGDALLFLVRGAGHRYRESAFLGGEDTPAGRQVLRLHGTEHERQGQAEAETVEHGCIIGEPGHVRGRVITRPLTGPGSPVPMECHFRNCSTSRMKSSFESKPSTI